MTMTQHKPIEAAPPGPGTRVRSSPTPILEGLRVDFVAGTLGQGGAERQLFYIVRALVESGAIPRVLSLSRGEFWQDEIIRAGAPVLWVGQSRSRFLRLGAIVRELRLRPPKFVQSQHFYTNLYTAAAARLLGIQEVGAIRNTVSYEVASTGRLLGPPSLHFPRRLAANSTSAIREAVARGVPASRITLLPNVVDTDLFVPPSERGSGAVRLLAVGRLVPQKRFDRFLEALARLRRTSPIDVTAALVGSGPLRADLEDLAERLGLRSVVEFGGSLPDMRAAYAAADAFVLTSDFEGTPNVILEAMSAGLPVVTTRAGDAGGLVRPGENGFVVEAGDDEALDHALGVLAADPGLRGAFGRQARQAVLANASLTQLPRILANLYGGAS